MFQSSPVPQVHAGPVVEKGKGKARAEYAESSARPTSLRTLLEALMQGPSEQELKDFELAIKLSLEDRYAADAKMGTSNAIRSSSGASSSRVTS